MSFVAFRSMQVDFLLIFRATEIESRVRDGKGTTVPENQGSVAERSIEKGN